ncbi:Trk system potassium uptake protein TrkH [Candidatus Bealeia paramacronuclearis]|uniref:Trk system potassium uptake protein TrkH n=1 Tax=Candidatus Bealeia paramacronuclearis TaxID=1921001 RepID=A0ABZ2C2W6_9PROT|nr:Trk system potassium uptake protein TrkH [Candidatus Bealeia paramacronuclearis]
MIAFRIIFFIVGILLTILAGAMAIPALLDIYYHDSDWVYFALSSGCTLFFGVLMILAFRPDGAIEPGIRETFLITVISWLALCLFGSLPFALSYAAPTFTDALFETTSALTTTGASVLTNLDFAPRGILLWRALLQWLGGVGIVLMALVILPNLRIGGMQLFRSEFSDRSEKILPRVSQIATVIFGTYSLITLTCVVSYWFAGMRSFEALCNAMTTVSTAGLSTSDSSFRVFDSTSIEMIACVFMLIGASPLILYARLFRGDFKSFLKDSQLRAFLLFTFLSILAMGLWLWSANTYELGHAFRHAAFSVISIVTTTGFSSADWGSWG